MSNNRKWIAIFLLASVAGLVSVYLMRNPNTSTKSNLVVSQSNLVETQPEVQPATTSDEQLSEVASVNTRADNQPLERVPLTPAEQEVVTKWYLSLGHRPYREHNPYEDYDLETLKKLASQGDIFALDEGATKVRLRNRENLALRMLNDASIRGSTVSLVSAGDMLEANARAIAEGSVKEFDEAKLRKDFQLKEGVPLQNALFRSATAHFLVAGIRGDRDRAEKYVDAIQKTWFGRPFNKREWGAAISDAEALYEHLSKVREKQGFGEFDNSYP